MLYRRGRIWWFKFRLAGRTFRESAKTTSKSLARDVERVRRRKIEANYNQVPKRITPRPIEVEAREWLVLKQTTLAPSSFGILEGSLRLHLLPKLRGRLFIDIDASLIARYQRIRVREGAAPKTVNIEVGVLRSLLRHHGMWSDELRRDVCALKVQNDRGIALSVDEEQRLTAACRESRSASLLLAFVLALQTGLRYSELRLLRWAQVDFLGAQLVVGQSKTAAGSGRVVPLNARALAELKQWATRVPTRAPEHYVFPKERVGQGGGYDTNPTQPIGSWKTAWARAKRVAQVKARFHDLRHTTCTRMLEGGVPLSVVATIMGWSASTTALMGKRYGHIGDAARRSAVAVLDKIGPESRATGHRIGHNPVTSRNVDPLTN